MSTEALVGSCLLCDNGTEMSPAELLAHLAEAHNMPTRPAELGRQEAVAFNVLSSMLPAGKWMPLSQRAAIARAIVEALHLDEHLNHVSDPLTAIPIMRAV